MYNGCLFKNQAKRLVPSCYRAVFYLNTPVLVLMFMFILLLLKEVYRLLVSLDTFGYFTR